MNGPQFSIERLFHESAYSVLSLGGDGPCQARTRGGWFLISASADFAEIRSNRAHGTLLHRRHDFIGDCLDEVVHVRPLAAAH